MNLQSSKFPIIFIISAFCPYLSIQLGVRVEHFIIYPSLFLILLMYKFKSINKYILIILALWSFIFIFLLTRTILDSNRASLVNILAEIDNFAQPIALMLIFASLIYAGINYEKDLLLRTSKVLVIFLSLNTVWTIIGFITDVHFINEYFWGGLSSVAINAEQMGRYSGIFNQPSEAGVAYSLGLFAIMYIMDREKKINIKHYFFIIFILFGGIVTVSKIFLFGGLLLFLFSIFMHKKVRKKLPKLLIWIPILSYPAYVFLINSWDGFDFIGRFFNGNNQQGFISLITAGRFGGAEGVQSQQSIFFSEILQTSPLIGAGMGHYQTVDTAFFHMFSNGGSIAMLIYLFILVFLFVLAIKFLIKCKFNSESKYFVMIVLLIFLGSFGVPILIINRSSIIIWVLISLLLRYYQVSKHCKEIT
jgi:hypothetical protein